MRGGTNHGPVENEGVSMSHPIALTAIGWGTNQRSNVG